MRTLQFVPFAAVALFLCLGSGPVYDSPDARTQSGQTDSGTLQQIIDVIGMIQHDARGYFIRGTKPAEIFRITNPNPAELDGIVAAGQPVKLRVRSVVGDNVAVESINGVSYDSP
jgi:hypothetical protein